MCGPEREEMAGNWRRLHNEEGRVEKCIKYFGWET
jgi:hypothetical protein